MLSEKRVKLVDRIGKVKVRLEDEGLILSDPEEEFLDTIVWSTQNFLRLISRR